MDVKLQADNSGDLVATHHQVLHPDGRNAHTPCPHRYTKSVKIKRLRDAERSRVFRDLRRERDITLSSENLSDDQIIDAPLADGVVNNFTKTAPGSGAEARPMREQYPLLNRLKFRHLRPIIELEATHNLHRTAERMNLSQPSVTKLL